MSANLKVTLGVLAVGLAVVVGIVVVDRNDTPTPAAAAEALVRPDSRRLSTSSGSGRRPGDQLVVEQAAHALTVTRQM